MIVVVDDDVDVREMLCEILTAKGYTVAGARNGSEALNVLREEANRVCLIFLDLMMPIMSGYQFLEERKADRELAKVPVVVMSARWEGSHEIDDIDFIRKPAALATILAFADSYCGDERDEGTNRC